MADIFSDLLCSLERSRENEKISKVKTATSLEVLPLMVTAHRDFDRQSPMI